MKHLSNAPHCIFMPAHLLPGADPGKPESPLPQTQLIRVEKMLCALHSEEKSVVEKLKICRKYLSLSKTVVRYPVC